MHGDCEGKEFCGKGYLKKQKPNEKLLSLVDSRLQNGQKEMTGDGEHANTSDDFFIEVTVDEESTDLEAKNQHI